ncbi:response regulator transcription factor [Paenibacillus ferrarius]|uniref:response regulator transcription factor n=1 Tax=Paenibacillus ferrarius TaxID=1469647 RepID=UPI003D2CFB2F
MPDMNGIELIEELRKIGFEGKIAILSGYSDFEYARQALRLDVDDYILKPVTIDNLEKMIKKIIEQLEKEMNAKVEQMRLIQRLQEYEPYVAKEWMKSVLTGTLEEKNNTLVPEPRKIWLEYKHIVLGIEMLRKGRLVDADTKNWNLFRFAAGNIIEEIAIQKWKFAHYSELHGSHGAVLIHLDPVTASSQEAMKIKINETCAEIISSVLTYLRVSIQIGVGEIKDNYKEIADSTEEAFQALLLKQKPSNAIINVFEATKTFVEDRNEYKPSKLQQDRPVKLLRLLSEAIMTSSQSDVNKITSEYIKQVQNLQPVTPLFVQVLGAELWHTFSSALLNSGVEMEKLYPDINLISELELISKISQLEEWFFEKMDVYFNSRTNSVSYKHKQTIDFMLAYIHGHLDQPLTLDELATQLFISKNHLNQIFKKATGDTFMTYLTRARMEKARALLQEGKYMIYEIAERVGFSNVPYFSTLFKKHFGLSPSDINNKYRNVIIDKN